MKMTKSIGLILTLVIGLVTGVTVSGYAEMDVTSKVQVIKSALSYDQVAKQSYLNVSAKNTSNDVLLTPIKVVIDSVSPSTVTVANADGVTADGKPFVLLTASTGQVLPAATSLVKKLAFANPTAVKFNYITKVVATIPEIVAEIGPSGGIVSMPDKSNPSVEAISIEFPSGTFTTYSAVTIDTTTPPPVALPSTPVGPIFNICPSGEYSQSINIKIIN